MKIKKLVKDNDKFEYICFFCDANTIKHSIYEISTPKNKIYLCWKCIDGLKDLTNIFIEKGLLK